ncbi:hypothetical protein MO867_12795 [Microbulbifer sp. OS29]|uniref:Uncharacterized protein n=1 Tax=Microbulbifer okhotskensis TaxID=2926617 RepID=A0A9X2EPZ3_9GAMM|nr:hypothetical protein [Microbulbifer okhotskensis]MCO1335210.1 hypothetical protein [Microbulbifer okhotskensis]
MNINFVWSTLTSCEENNETHASPDFLAFDALAASRASGLEVSHNTFWEGGGSSSGATNYLIIKAQYRVIPSIKELTWKQIRFNKKRVHKAPL